MSAGSVNLHYKDIAQNVGKVECLTRLTIERFFTDNVGAIEALIHSMQSLSRSVNVDRNIQSLLHPALLEAYTPVRTSGDLWNAVSIVLSGSERYTYCLRVLTAYGMIKFKNRMIALIQRQSISELTTECHSYLERLLRLLRGDQTSMSM